MAEKTVLVVLILCLVQWTEILADVCYYNNGAMWRYCGGTWECCVNESSQCCQKEDNTSVIVVGAALGGTLVIALVVGAIFYCVVKNKKRAHVGPGMEMNFVGRVHVTGAPVPPTYGPMETYQPPSYEDVQGPSVPPPAPIYDGGDMQKVKL